MAGTTLKHPILCCTRRITFGQPLRSGCADPRWLQITTSLDLKHSAAGRGEGAGTGWRWAAAHDVNNGAVVVMKPATGRFWPWWAAWTILTRGLVAR